MYFQNTLTAYVKTIYRIWIFFKAFNYRNNKYWWTFKMLFKIIINLKLCKIDYCNSLGKPAKSNIYERLYDVCIFNHLQHSLLWSQTKQNFHFWRRVSWICKCIMWREIRMCNKIRAILRTFKVLLIIPKLRSSEIRVRCDVSLFVCM